MALPSHICVVFLKDQTPSNMIINPITSSTILVVHATRNYRVSLPKDIGKPNIIDLQLVEQTANGMCIWEVLMSEERTVDFAALNIDNQSAINRVVDKLKTFKIVYFLNVTDKVAFRRLIEKCLPV